MRIATLLIALAIIVPVGIFQGRSTGRWSTPEAFDARLAAIDQIPLRIGDWTGTVVEPEAKTFERAGVAGGRMLRYVAPSGGVISAMIVCGRPGPTSVHTPEVCYAGAGYEPASPKSRVAVTGEGGRADELWTTDFLKQDAPTPEYLRIFHAWGADGRWRASTNPRLDFAGSRALYKLYVIRPMTHLEVEPKADPALAFMGMFLPEIRKALSNGL